MAPRALGILLELPPNPIGGIGIERSGGLVKLGAFGGLWRGPRVSSAQLTACPSGGQAAAVSANLRRCRRCAQRHSRRRKDQHRQRGSALRSSASEGRHKGSGNSSAALQHGIPTHISAKNPDLARGESRSRRRSDGRGLAGTVASEQRDCRGRLNSEADMVDRSHVTINLSQIAHSYRDTCAHIIFAAVGSAQHSAEF